MYRRILLVVEANRSRHVVVDRALATLALHRAHTQIRVLVLVNSDSSDTLAENPAMYRNREWLENLTRPLDLIRADYDLMVSWSTHFAASILFAARQFKTTIIGIPIGDSVGDGELAMLREAPCPVMFIRPGGSPVKRRSVLAAIRPVIGDDGKPHLNHNVLERSRAVASLHEAELHAVYVSKGKDSMSLEQVAEAAKLEPEQVHRVNGAPDTAIRQLIEEVNADLLVLGSRERRSAQSLRGGLIDRLLGTVAIDVLVTD